MFSDLDAAAILLFQISVTDNRTADGQPLPQLIQQGTETSIPIFLQESPTLYNLFITYLIVQNR